MRTKALSTFLAAPTLVGICCGQILSQPGFSQAPFSQPAFAHRVNLPPDASVVLVGDEWGGSTASIRGGAYQLEVRVSLALRNVSKRRVRGITLTVTAQETAVGGRGSITVPSLDAAPGETFNVKGDLHLLRPLGSGSPVVEIGLDGILFDDLTFLGPDRLNSRRAMMLWELEARRDRQYFKEILEQSGREAIQREMLAGLAAEADRQQFNVQLLQGRATNIDPSKELKFAFLNFPEAPVEALNGAAHPAGDLSSTNAWSPRLVVHNRSGSAVRYFEMGWIVRDRQGREFLAASIPSDLRLMPRSSAQVVPDAALRFDPRTPVEAMTAFISNVEFADGSLWIPSRDHLADPTLRRVLALSPEHQRLLQIYRRRGLNAVVEDLKKF